VLKDEHKIIGYLLYPPKNMLHLWGKIAEKGVVTPASANCQKKDINCRQVLLMDRDRGTPYSGLGSNVGHLQ